MSVLSPCVHTCSDQTGRETGLTCVFSSISLYFMTQLLVPVSLKPKKGKRVDRKKSRAMFRMQMQHVFMIYADANTELKCLPAVAPTKVRSVEDLCAIRRVTWEVHKTCEYFLRYFLFWSPLKRDVSAYIKTRPMCQRMGKLNQTIKPASLFNIPVVSQAYEHLIINCVGSYPVLNPEVPICSL